MTLTGIPLADRLEPGSPEWLGKMTASQIPTVVGMGWGTPHSLWHEKAGTTPRPAMTDSMKRGHELEPLIVAHYMDRHPELSVEYPARTFIHPTETWAAANPDAIDDAETLIEVKSVHPDGVRHWRDGVPDHIQAQVQFQMWVTGAAQCVVVMASGFELFDRRPREYRVDADPAVQSWLMREGLSFMQSLELGIEPPANFRQSSDREVLRWKHTEIVDDPGVEIPAEMARPWLNALAEQLAATEDRDAYQAQLLAFLGDAKKATFGGVTLGTRRRGRGDGPPSFSTAQKLAERASELLKENAA